MPASRKKIVVVGAGLGGISAAICLATAGFEVELFEKNERIGGKLNIMKTNGYSFDLGPSILILPHIFQRLFTRLGRNLEDYVAVQEITPHWRNFFEDGTVIDLHPDMKVMERELAKFGPKASKGFYAYLEYSRKLWKFSEEAYFSRGSDRLRDVLKGYNPIELVCRADPFRTMTQGVRRYIKNPYLRDIMGFFIKYVGSSAKDAPAIFNLLAYSQFGYGLWYVTGGMYNLALGLGNLLRELGVTINLQSEVVEIAKSGTRVHGIVLKNGEHRPADFIVSNMEVIPTYKNLLNVTGPFLDAYERKFEPSCSGLVIHLGLDREYPQLAHHNFVYARNQALHYDLVYRKKQLPNDPTIYLVAPTRTDKTLAPQGHEILKLLPHIPHLQNPPYTQTDYEALKQKLYLKLERIGLEDLRKHIVYEDMLTPDDLQRMYYSNKGSIYGVVANLKQNLGFRAPKHSELYRNLYFVGGSVNPGGGMPMVIYSGQMVSDKIVAATQTIQL